MRQCEQERESTAPRLGCQCRECHYARKKELPRSLIEMADGRTTYPGYWDVGMTPHIINQGISRYLRGDIGLDEMKIAIIRELAKQLEEQYRQRSQLIERKGPRVFP